MAQTKKKTTKTETGTEKKHPKKLLIVESPSKAKTIKKYLNGKYEVLSSKGHISDLPASRLGVDVEHGFAPEYIVSRKDGKSAVLKELKAAAKDADSVYLATDPDREGEAIAWHLARLLGLDPGGKVRVSFDEITKNAVTSKVKEPRSIDLDLVSAQQARRVLDRLVGYKISPFLWKKIKRGLSAGRVQSVAAKMVVDRERQIRAFKPKEYWTLDAVFADGARTFKASFYGKDGKKTDIPDKETLDSITAGLEAAEYVVDEIKRQPRHKQPRPPFTTSSLQQDASARLNMRPKKTMAVAQALYEGVDIKGVGLTGLITYMRTDSLRVSDEARAAAKELIVSKYGADAYPAKPRVYKSRAGAQDAHEAIRPSDINILPETIKDKVPAEQYRLYKLIWDRFVASQMSSAEYDSMSVSIGANGYVFRTSASRLVKKGFTVLYNYSDGEEDGQKLPALKEGDVLDFVRLDSEQKFTQPPARYTESSLIKAMEDNGIGRPSTYAPTISNIIDHGYVSRKGKTLEPTQMGEITTDLLSEHFADIVDTAFTTDMESQLDRIARGERTYEQTMNDFYGDFSRTLQKAEKELDGVRIKVPDEESDVICDRCGARMVYKDGRYGRFLACPNYPNCKNTKPIVTYADGNCPVCGKRMTVRRTASKKTFYACEDRAGCNFMTWDTPVKDVCPKCGSTLFRKPGRRLVCLREGCGYTAAEKKKANKDAE